MPFLEAQLVQADVGDHPLGVDDAVLGQLVLDDVFHHLGRDAQTAGHLLSIAADQRSEHELFEALGVGDVLALERRNDVLPVIAPGTAMEGGLIDPETGLVPDVEVPDHLGRRLERDVGGVLTSAALTAAAFGQGPTDLEAMSVLVAFVTGNLDSRRQIDINDDAGHDCSAFNVSGRWCMPWA
jgi:hypothetical protein